MHKVDICLPYAYHGHIFRVLLFIFSSIKHELPTFILKKKIIGYGPKNSDIV